VKIEKGDQVLKKKAASKSGSRGSVNGEEAGAHGGGRRLERRKTGSPWEKEKEHRERDLVSRRMEITYFQ